MSQANENENDGTADDQATGPRPHNALEHALDRELAAFYEDEYAIHGEEMDQWYRIYYRRNNWGLAPYNIGLADFVTANFPTRRFVEIGAGLGQISMLLATRKQHAVAIEGHSTEILPRAQRAFKRVTEKIYPDLPKYMTLRYDWFPRSASEYVTPDSILCFPTLYGGMTPDEEKKIFRVISTVDGVILSLRDFFSVRRTQEERDVLIEKIRSYGFEPPVVVQHWESYSPDTTVYFKRSPLLSRLKRKLKLA